MNNIHCIKYNNISFHNNNKTNNNHNKKQQQNKLLDHHFRTIFIMKAYIAHNLYGKKKLKYKQEIWAGTEWENQIKSSNTDVCSKSIPSCNRPTYLTNTKLLDQSVLSITNQNFPDVPHLWRLPNMGQWSSPQDVVTDPNTFLIYVRCY